MPLPLCAKELEDVFTQEEEEEGVEVTPGGKGEEQDLDLEVEAIMEASLRRDLFTCKVQEIVSIEHQSQGLYDRKNIFQLARRPLKYIINTKYA